MNTPDPAREDARRPDGRFGEQPRADAGQLDLAAEWVEDGVTPHPTGGYVRIDRSDSKSRYRDQYGLLHRLDGPAVIYVSGTQEWWVRGRKHREDGPALTRWTGEARWHLDGMPHREDGPAVLLPHGRQEWFLDGLRHRTDGPALIHADGAEERWIHGVQVDPPDPN